MQLIYFKSDEDFLLYLLLFLVRFLFYFIELKFNVYITLVLYY